MTDQQPYSLSWRQTVDTPALVRWEAGDYRLDGWAQPQGASVPRSWTLTYRDTVIGNPSGLAEGKRDADVHRGVSPSAPRTIAAASVDDSPGLVYARNKQRAIAFLRDGPPPVGCTHGGDCPVHPDQLGVHDFTPGAVEALRAVLIQVRYLPITETTLRQIVASLGVDFADVERDL